MRKYFLILSCIVLGLAAKAATPVAIPTALDEYINWSNADLSNCQIENSGANVGSTGANTVITFSLTNTTEQEYFLTMKTAAKNLTAVLTVSVRNGGTTLFTTDRDVLNTGSWYLADKNNPTLHEFSIGTLPVGTLTLEIRVKSTTGSYAGNYGCLAIHGMNQYTPEGLHITALTIDGDEAEEAILNGVTQSGGSYTVSGNIYTTVPAVAATFNTGQAVTVTPAVSGTTATYSLSNGYGFSSTLTIEGIHAYTPAGTENTVQLKYTGDGKQGAGNWTNGLYSLHSTSLDGWNNSSFKLNAAEDTIYVPANIVVKQLVFKDLANNYDGDASVSSVTTEGTTTVWLPTKRYALKDKAYDLVVNIEGHQAGTPLIFTMVKAGQPTAWFELTVEEVSAGNPTLVSSSATVDANHVVVAVAFDREVVSAIGSCAGQSIQAEGGSNTLYFLVWDLDYNTDYTFSLAKEAIRDNFGAAALADVTVPFTTGNAPSVNAALPDYIVSTASELTAAIEAVKASNTTADAARKIIFVKNGTYDFGRLDGSYQYNLSFSIDNWNNVYNVSLIGESKEGVIITGNTDGITSSTLNLGNGTGIYVQDITIRNDYRWGSGNFRGVSVAVNGGNKAVLKNVAMQSYQDTYVTGKRTYLEDCDIYGTVDFICGGGDIFFEHNNLILCDPGDVIVAPNTSSDIRWGYVLDNCTVKADQGADVQAGSWHLGRPWQNEPRSVYLHTTMEVPCAAEGWKAMSTIPTHFYEYDSRDAAGNVIDLSARTNSSTSTNTYVPVLTDEQAASYTVRNVLGGTDSWDAAASAAQATADVTSIDADAAYLIEDNGAFVTIVKGASLDLSDYAGKTIRRANAHGGFGAPVAIPSDPTGIDQITNQKSQITNKVIRNGQLLIIRDNKTYNVLGAQL